MADKFIRRAPGRWIAALALVTTSTAAWAQQGVPPDPQAATAAPSPGSARDPLGKPTELGIRLTPDMARAIAGRFVKETAPRYELDTAKYDEAGELVARRLMAAAHATDGRGAELVEYVMAQALSFNERQRSGQGGNFMTPEVQAGLAKRLIPLIPAVKDLLGGVVQDVTPMLPLKQKLKLSGQLLLAGTALEAFENNMQRWARGEGGPNDDPFAAPTTEADATRKDANGQTVVLKRAREAAEKDADREAVLKNVWSSYLEDAKKYYALDASQSAAGDSILRECLERARAAVKDPAWHDQYCRVRLWQELVWRTRMTRGPFFNQMLQQEVSAALQPLDALGDEFRLRIDDIATQAQRTAAEERIAAALADHGYTDQAAQEAQ